MSGLTPAVPLSPSSTKVPPAPFLREGLALYAWVLCCPSRWHAHVAAIDPVLPPDFSLAHLSRARLRRPALRRLLLQVAIMGAAIALVATVAAVVIAGIDARHRGMAVLFGLGLGLTGTVITASGLSVIGAAWGGPFICVVFALACGMALDAVGGAGPLVARFDALDPVARVAGGLPAVVPPAPAVGAAIAIAIGIAGCLAAAAGRDAISSAGRQAGAAVLGILTCLATHGGTVLLLLFVAATTDGVIVAGATMAAITMATVFAVCRLLGRPVRVATIVAGGVGATLAVTMSLGSTSGSPARQILAGGAATAIFYSVLFVLAFVLARRLGGRWAGAVASAVGSGTAFVLFGVMSSDALPWSTVPLSLLGNGVGLLLLVWWPMATYPAEMAWNLTLLRRDLARPSTAGTSIYWHSAFWHERQWLPLRGLDDHIRLTWQRNPRLGLDVIERVATTRQRWAAQAARVELDARILEDCRDIAAIARLPLRLGTGGADGPAGAILRGFLHAADRTAVALAQGNLSDQDVHVAGVEQALDALAQDLTRAAPPAHRFLPIARRWREITRAHREALGRLLADRREIRNPYVRGMPLTDEQDIFVGRGAVCQQLVHVLLHQARSAILLYGQRRVGKTSLLNRLGRMLPADIVPLFADLQGVVTASGHGGLLFGLARSMAGSARHHRGLAMAVPPRERFADDPFLTFDLWLDDLEHALGSRTGLVALDEFEALDAAFRRERFDEQDVLGLLRHVIQHRHRLAVLVAGSHALEEIGNWATYLINSQAIHLSYLHADEARQLIERPMADFPLRYEEDAVEHLIDLTRGHPSLVQLLCYHVVSLKNAQPVARRWDVTVADIEAAVPDALGSGAMLFLDMRAQAGPTGTAILERLATAGTGAARDRTAFADLADQRDLDAAVERLLRRELIEHAGGGVRMQVELVRRWFAAAASQRAPGPAIVD